MSSKEIILISLALAIGIVIAGFIFLRLNNPFNDIRRTCTVSADCLIIDQQADLKSCWSGYCPTGDLNQPQFLSVNRLSYESYLRKALGKNGINPDSCGQPPLCPKPALPITASAKCDNSVCIKR